MLWSQEWAKEHLYPDFVASVIHSGFHGIAIRSPSTDACGRLFLQSRVYSSVDKREFFKPSIVGQATLACSISSNITWKVFRSDVVPYKMQEISGWSIEDAVRRRSRYPPLNPERLGRVAGTCHKYISAILSVVTVEDIEFWQLDYPSLTRPFRMQMKSSTC